MPPKTSAGILLYRRGAAGLEVLLVHPGGPFWAKKDVGAWSLPKGEVAEGEDARRAAVREFVEETGLTLDGELQPLRAVRVSSGKTVVAFAVEGDCDPAAVRSNLFEMEWPPKSGRKQQFPEVDRAAWFGIEEARTRIVKGQLPILDELASRWESPR
jgi:predicted NUDIX family NTP pyrophosphohydrolase